MRKKTILIFTGLYLPGYKGGGPIRTISNLVDNLSDDYDFKIITSDRDLGDSKPYKNVDINQWNEVDKAQVYYIQSPVSYKKISDIIENTNYDILYLNSFFSPKFTILPLIVSKIRKINKPVILSPKGEFSPNALKLKSFKKEIFIKISNILGIYSNIYWHASTGDEKEQIKNFSIKYNYSILDQRIKIAKDLPSKQLPVKNTAIEDNIDLKICFLSRISPMKNLDYALDVLSKIKISIIFNIYGPKEDLEYWEMCLRKISKLPSNIVVNIQGIVKPDEVCGIISQNHLFFVPSRGENYGHVFFEALNSGTPIIVSDKTPWRNLESYNIGWDISLDHSKDFIKAIEKYSDMSLKERKIMSDNCIEYAKSLLSSNEDLMANLNLFNNVECK